MFAERTVCPWQDCAHIRLRTEMAACCTKDDFLQGNQPDEAAVRTELPDHVSLRSVRVNAFPKWSLR